MAKLEVSSKKSLHLEDTFTFDDAWNTFNDTWNHAATVFNKASTNVPAEYTKWAGDIDKEEEKAVTLESFDDKQTSYSLGHVPYEWLKTQKAQGLWDLLQDSENTYVGDVYIKWWKNRVIIGRAKVWRAPSAADQALTKYYNLDSELSAPPFARPCPVKPRHGFVDSRRVAGITALTELARETYKEDKDAEILLMPFLKAEFSFIRTPESITIGRGHDGVTAGRSSDLLDLPSSGSADDFQLRCQDKHGQRVLHEGLLNIHGDYRYTYVQARQVSEVTNSTEFIPDDPAVWQEDRMYQVTHVVDLTCHTPKSIEKYLARYTARGTAFVTKSLISHQACQVIAAGRPLLRDKTYGDVEGRRSNFAQRRTQDELNHLADLIPRFMKPSRIFPLADSLVVSTQVHNASYVSKALMTMRLDLSLNRRFAAEHLASLFIYAAIGCAGEARHWYQVGPGIKYGGNPPLGKKYYDKYSPNHFTKMSLAHYRHHIFNEIGQSPRLSSTLRVLIGAHCSFRKPNWVPGYGGRKWGRIARRTVGFYRVLRMFTMKPTEKHFMLMVKAGNNLSREVHNGGAGVLSKFASCRHTGAPRLRGVSVSQLFNETELPEKCYLPRLTTRRVGQQRNWIRPTATLHNLVGQTLPIQLILNPMATTPSTVHHILLLKVPPKYKNVPIGLYLFSTFRILGAPVLLNDELSALVEEYQSLPSTNPKQFCWTGMATVTDSWNPSRHTTEFGLNIPALGIVINNILLPSRKGNHSVGESLHIDNASYIWQSWLDKIKVTKYTGEENVYEETEEAPF